MEAHEGFGIDFFVVFVTFAVELRLVEEVR